MQKFRDLAIALSLANLCFFGTWSELLLDDPGHYHRMSPPLFAFAAVILNVWLLAALFWGVMMLVRHSRQIQLLSLARWSFLVVFFISLNGMRQTIPALTFENLSAFFGHAGLQGLMVIITLTTALTLLRWQRRVIHAAAALVLALFPFVLLTFSRAGWSLLSHQPSLREFAEKRPARILTDTSRPVPRVLWLVFDGLDQRLTFVDRPSTVRLPKLDRFRSQALYTSNAYSPASYTLLSMPSLITGKLISKAQIISADELRITFAGAKDPVDWSTQPNIFSRARELGFHTAVIGWYHCYCRVIGDSLTTCAFYGWNKMAEETMFESVSNQLAQLVSALPAQSHLGLVGRFKRFMQAEYMNLAAERIRRYQRIFEDTAKAAANPDLGLTLVHWTIPHPPAIYDRFKQDFTLNGGRSYLDDLELVDLTLGELRRAMETAGVWETTTVLITSDHSYRKTWKASASEEAIVFAGKNDLRVPFLLKLAGQTKPFVYEPTFNTVLTHDMILALLRGEISSPEGLVTWLDRHRSPHGPIDKDTALLGGRIEVFSPTP